MEAVILGLRKTCSTYVVCGFAMCSVVLSDPMYRCCVFVLRSSILLLGIFLLFVGSCLCISCLQARRLLALVKPSTYFLRYGVSGFRHLQVQDLGTGVELSSLMSAFLSIPGVVPACINSQKRAGKFIDPQKTCKTIQNNVQSTKNTYQKHPKTRKESLPTRQRNPTQELNPFFGGYVVAVLLGALISSGPEVGISGPTWPFRSRVRLRTPFCF